MRFQNDDLLKLKRGFFRRSDAEHMGSLLPFHNTRPYTDDAHLEAEPKKFLRGRLMSPSL